MSFQVDGKRDAPGPESPDAPRRGLGGLRTWMLAAGLISLAIYIGLTWVGDLRPRIGLYLAAHGLLFVIYAAIVVAVARSGARGGGASLRGASAQSLTGGRGFCAEPTSGSAALSLGRVTRRPSRAGAAAAWLLAPERTILLFAVAFRAALVLGPASLSDDLYRYVWDGRVQAAGINPYRDPPDSVRLRPLRDEAWERINHREIRTVYPPASEVLFLAAAAAGLRETGFKVVFCLFDLAVALALGEILRRTGRPPLLAVVYAWNPLVVVEVASSGHSDSVGLFLILASLGFIIGERRTLSITAYAGSVLARLLPLAYAPIFLRRFKARHLVIGMAILALGFAPYAGARANLFSGFRAYAENWDYNSVVFPALRAVLEQTVPVDALKDLVTILKNALGDPAWCQVLYRYVWPAPLARALLAVAMLAGAFAISFRIPEVEREIFLASSLLLVLTPTLHPWYLVWVLPFAALRMSVSWILFSGLAPLSYLSLRTADGRVPSWALGVEWSIPFVTALVIRAWKPRSATPYLP